MWLIKNSWPWLIALLAARLVLQLPSIALIIELFSSTPTTAAEEDFHHFLANYSCKHSYTNSILNRDPYISLLDGFLQPGEAEYIRHIAYSPPLSTNVYTSQKTTDATVSGD